MRAADFMRGRLRSRATRKCLADGECWGAVRRQACQHLQLRPWLEAFDRRKHPQHDHLAGEISMAIFYVESFGPLFLPAANTI